ncbi:MAG: mechanosensitive ion channel [Candidatus Cloacimonetes bacterium]|nr:mechanosensitive ion channel [Candidatus Cloacimonadota bacterium]MCF7815322.1 mechanosensitive ion channel [Candidatus Cloacimonadota bacterium]MCF7883309.1 mechanosensitive ion channel [Candidatus Cloacimonadota bacterium]
MENILPKIYEWISAFGLKFLAALAILIIGRIIVNSIKKLIVKVMDKRHVDPTITTFLSSLIKTVLWVFVILAALAQLGIQTTSFLAVIGAAGLAIGLALQGSLSNFASGFLIILFRPFKVGDAVEAGGVMGMINQINMFNTEFRSFDNKKIIVPNSQIMNGTITNYTAENQRRVDLTFGVGYGSDIQKVKDILKSIINQHDLILKEPEPFVRLTELADSSLNFKVRVWSKTEDYWTVFFDLTETAKMEFDKNGINIPFPQMDVHIKNQ